MLKNPSMDCLSRLFFNNLLNMQIYNLKPLLSTAGIEKPAESVV